MLGHVSTDIKLMDSYWVNAINYLSRKHWLRNVNPVLLLHLIEKTPYLNGVGQTWLPAAKKYLKSKVNFQGNSGRRDLKERYDGNAHHWIRVTSLLAEQIQPLTLRGSRDRRNPWHADSKTSIQAEVQHPDVQTLLQSCCNKTKTFVSFRLLNWAKQEELWLLLCFQCHFLDMKQVGKWAKEIISASSEAYNMWKINTSYHIQRKELEEMCENDEESMAHASILRYIPSIQFHRHNFNKRLIKNCQGGNTTSECFSIVWSKQA